MEKQGAGFLTLNGCAVRLASRTEVLKTRDKLRPTTQSVAIKGNPLFARHMVRRPGRNRAIVMAKNGATARVTHAGPPHGNCLACPSTLGRAEQGESNAALRSSQPAVAHDGRCSSSRVPFFSIL